MVLQRTYKSSELYQKIAKTCCNCNFDFLTQVPYFVRSKKKFYINSFSIEREREREGYAYSICLNQQTKGFRGLTNHYTKISTISFEVNLRIIYIKHIELPNCHFCILSKVHLLSILRVQTPHPYAFPFFRKMKERNSPTRKCKPQQP